MFVLTRECVPFPGQMIPQLLKHNSVNNTLNASCLLGAGLLDGVEIKLKGNLVEWERIS